MSSRFFRTYPFGGLSDLFRLLSDLHLGDQRVTWKKLVYTSVGRNKKIWLPTFQFCHRASSHGAEANPMLHDTCCIAEARINDTVDGRDPAPPGMYKTL